ncbi:MAG: hypothetical protein ACRDP1_15330 [Nocardioidaceae bacterium]
MVDAFGLPLRATDGDLGDDFFGLLGRIVVLFSANERLVALLDAFLQNQQLPDFNDGRARPVVDVLATCEELLRGDGEQGKRGASRADLLTDTFQFLTAVSRSTDSRNGYIHSSWLVDDRRESADAFERAPEFLALRVGAQKKSPGLIHHSPQNLDELRAGLLELAATTALGYAALDQWHERLGIGWAAQ